MLFSFDLVGLPPHIFSFWFFFLFTFSFVWIKSETMCSVEIKVQWSMFAGNSIYLVCSFKIAGGNGFQEGKHRHTSHVFLTFFSRLLHHHIRPTVSKNGSHQVAATFDTSAFMPFQAGQNLHEYNSRLVSGEPAIAYLCVELPLIILPDL